MSSFKSSFDFQFFVDEVRTERRFVQGETAKAFFEVVSNHSKCRELVVPPGKTFSRAQLGSANPEDAADLEGVVRAPFSFKRMMPPRENASEGRINPRGIAYLYLATDDKTAISEVRPRARDFVTVTQFKTNRPLTLVCFPKGSPVDETRALQNVDRLSLPGADKEAFQRDVDQDVWEDICHAFSEPVRPSDQHLHYVPTQIIAELLVNGNYDGIIYKSGLRDDGYNLALFELDSVKPVSSRLVQISSVEYTEVGIPRFD